MPRQLTLKQRLANTGTAVIVLLLSLLLLLYVGLGEAYRTYPKFFVEKLAAQGEIIKSSMQTFVVAGLPLDQFPGFTPLTEPLLQSDKTLAKISVANTQDQVIFENGQPGQALSRDRFTPSPLQTQENSAYEVAESANFYRVRLLLQNKFERLGSLDLTTSKQAIANIINVRFIRDGVVAACCLLGYGVLAFLAYGYWTYKKAQRWLNLAFGGLYVFMSIVAIATLVNIYTEGIQARASALANSLAGRLNAAVELGLKLEDFDGIDQTFAEYQKLNPDISFIALTTQDHDLGKTPQEKIKIHTNPQLIGNSWQSLSSDFVYPVSLKDTSVLQFTVRLGIPWRVIYIQLWRSAKNFVVLFIASAFIAVLFLNLMSSFTGHAEHTQQQDPEAEQEFRLDLIGPLFFLAVFAEGLSVPLLPPYFQAIAQQNQIPNSLVSALFTTYFAFFVLSLIPGSRLAQTKGTKPLLLAGGIFASLGLFLMAGMTNFYGLFVLRALAGLGQGLIYIGVQSYILEVASQEKKTQGTAIIVINYNTGMLSGTAIGSLLAAYMGTKSVFLLGSLATLFGLCYTYALVPNVQEPTGENQANSWREFLRKLSFVLKDYRFLAGMFLVGIPARATLTGVTIFALPLLLSRQNYAQEDVGQVLMFYAIGVLVANVFTARLADRTGKVGQILLIGMIGSGLGLILIGLVSWQEVLSSYFYALPAVVLVGGTALLGLAHGFINAPVVTYITDTPVAVTLGKGSIASLYRFLERMGHVLGPVIVGQLLLLNQGSFLTMSWLGILTLGLGGLFALTLKQKRVTPT